MRQRLRRIETTQAEGAVGALRPTADGLERLLMGTFKYP
jgi:hypothetical protein